MNGMRALSHSQACPRSICLLRESYYKLPGCRQPLRALRVYATANKRSTEPLGTASPPKGRILSSQTAEALASRPGYPLESPGITWNGAVLVAYALVAALVFAEQSIPEQLRTIIYAVFTNHTNIVNFGLGAAAIHAVYVAVVLSVSSKRGYDAKATAWWAFSAFVFGFLGLKMFLDKQD